MDQVCLCGEPLPADVQSCGGCSASRKADFALRNLKAAQECRGYDADLALYYVKVARGNLWSEEVVRLKAENERYREALEEIRHRVGSILGASNGR